MLILLHPKLYIILYTNPDNLIFSPSWLPGLILIDLSPFNVFIFILSPNTAYATDIYAFVVKS